MGVNEDGEDKGRQSDQKKTAEPSVDLSNLGAMAGGAAGTGSALPTLQGDTTWGGRPAFPQVITPAITLGYPGLPTLTNNVDHMVFSVSTSTVPGFFDVDSNGLPETLKSADLVFGIVGFDLSLFGGPAHTFFPLSAMLMSSPLIGYDMINWAENGSVIPQNRVFFDYRHFDAVGSIELVNFNGPDPAHGHPNAYMSQQRAPALVGGSLRRRFREDVRQGPMVGGSSLSLPGPSRGNSNVLPRSAAAGCDGSRQRWPGVETLHCER